MLPGTENEVVWVPIFDDVARFFRRGIVEAEASVDGGQVTFTMQDGTRLRMVVAYPTRWCVAV